MNDPAVVQQNLFLFSIAQVHFGVDAAQVIEVNAYDGGHHEQLFRFHEELGYGHMAIEYLSPAVVTIKTADGHPYRVLIDAIEDIAPFNRSDIHPFPEVLAPFAHRNCMWGVLCRSGAMVILVDFVRLAEKRRADRTLAVNFDV